MTAPEGACEFIDFELASVRQYGGRYIVMMVNSFTEQPFVTLPECYAGWMLRQHPGSGEVFEPRMVQQKLDVTADTQICLPVILDVAANQVIWTDLALRRDPTWANNVEGNQQGVLLMGQAMTSLVQPNLYELFTLHAAARGTSTTRERADLVFAPDGAITPFDSAVIRAEFL